MNSLRQNYLLQHRLLLLLIALTLVRGLLYASLTIPWWQGHDEEFHFAQVKLLSDRWLNTPLSHQGQSWTREMVATFNAFPGGRWSQWSERQIGLANISNRYTSFRQSSLSYYLYAWLARFLYRQDILFQLFSLRVISVLISCGTIIFAFLSAQKIFPDSLMAQVLVPWLVLFNPSFMITGSTVSDSDLAILLSTIIFYLLLAEITKNRVSWRSFIALILTIAAFQSKPTTYFLLIVWGLLLLNYIWQSGQKYWRWIVMVGGFFAISIPFLWPGIQRNLVPFLRASVSSEGLAYAFSSEYFWYTFSFFWIILGWSVHRLAPIWYLLLLIVVLSAIAGLFLCSWRYIKNNSVVTVGFKQKSLLLSLLFAGLPITALVIITILRPNSGAGRSTRYIFPVIVPLSILLVGGWRALLPPSWREIGLALLAVAFFLFDTMVWWLYAIPWYYPFWPQY